MIEGEEMSDLISRQRVRFELVESTMPKKYRNFCAKVIDDENLVPSKNKVYPVFTSAVRGSMNKLKKIFTSEKAAKDYCEYLKSNDIPENPRFHRYEEWELSE